LSIYKTLPGSHAESSKSTGPCNPARQEAILTFVNLQEPARGTMLKFGNLLEEPARRAMLKFVNLREPVRIICTCTAGDAEVCQYRNPCQGRDPAGSHVQFRDSTRTCQGSDARPPACPAARLPGCSTTRPLAAQSEMFHLS
jgi:hypothetical protein